MLCGFILHPFFTHLNASRGSWGLGDVGACASLDADAAVAILAALKERVGQAARLAPERVTFPSCRDLFDHSFISPYVLTANTVPSLACPTEARSVSAALLSRPATSSSLSQAQSPCIAGLAPDFPEKQQRLPSQFIERYWRSAVDWQIGITYRRLCSLPRTLLQHIGRATPLIPRE